MSYARANVHPKISDEAVNGLIEGYLTMRRFGASRASKVISATPRQLESLIRISEALARMRYAYEFFRPHTQLRTKRRKFTPSTHTVLSLHAQLEAVGKTLPQHSCCLLPEESHTEKTVLLSHANICGRGF